MCVWIHICMTMKLKGLELRRVGMDVEVAARVESLANCNNITTMAMAGLQQAFGWLQRRLPGNEGHLFWQQWQLWSYGRIVAEAVGGGGGGDMQLLWPYAARCMHRQFSLPTDNAIFMYIYVYATSSLRRTHTNTDFHIHVRFCAGTWKTLLCAKAAVFRFY